jgi:ParB family chromosome partitioning protein
VSVKRRGLGRGLEALIGGPEDALQQVENSSGGQLRSIAIDTINRGTYQPRVHFEPEALEELAASIRAQGVLQPIVVRPNSSGYELVAGERRWRAAQLAGLQDIPAVVRDLDDSTAAAIALIENIQRENLNALEQANALQRLIDEFGMTHQQTADAVGRSRAAVSNLLRLRELPEPVKRNLEQGELDMGHARALLGLEKGLQSELAAKIVRQGLSVRDTEALVRNHQQAKSSTKKAKTRKDPDISRLEMDLADKLGAKIQIQHGPKGQGKLIVHYKSSDELEGILKKVR